jgi:hypothetical protein
MNSFRFDDPTAARLSNGAGINARAAAPPTHHRAAASTAELLWNAAQAAAAAPPPLPSIPPSVAYTAPAPVILITSNLQHDFFTRFPKRRETMNRYWVGRKESERVLGYDAKAGPLAQLMNWVRSVARGGDGSVPESRTSAHDHPPPPAPSDTWRSNIIPGFQDRELDPEEGGAGADALEGEGDDADIDIGENPQQHAATSAVGHATAATVGSGHFLIPPQYSAGLTSLNPAAASLIDVSPSPAPSSGALSPTAFLRPSSRAPATALSASAPSSALPSPTRPQANSSLHLASSSSAGASLPPPAVYVIHLRTVVDPSHPSSAECIERYGEYCLAGSEGVRLCNGMDEQHELYPMECIVETNRLLTSQTYRTLKKKIGMVRSFFQQKHEASLAAQEAKQSEAGGLMSRSNSIVSTGSASSSSLIPPLRIAVIGGWTEEDVFHLCYELRTRLPRIEMATCAHLTASPSVSQHWGYLDKIRRVMNVQITRTVRELITWFRVGKLPYRLSGVKYIPAAHWPKFEWVGGTSSIPASFNPDQDGELLAQLYPHSGRLLIDPLVGGFSPSIVLSVESIDRVGGGVEAPSVVKLAPSSDIATEYTSFQRIEEQLGNNAPSVRGCVELGSRGGLKFRYTRMSSGRVRRLLDLLTDLTLGEPLPPILEMIDRIFQQIFGAWFRASQTEMIDLVRYYFDGFATSRGETGQFRWDSSDAIEHSF